ncbi:MAG: TonB-dependent receptor, partial [Terracidiphilus sp.]
SIPGRAIQDLVNSEPGWLYEGNAVLHPRGSEYQTQFVIDGIPLTDNRSPGFGPSIEANNIQSMSIYTAGIPAQYGRSLGGVVVVDTIENEQPGWHGELTLLGGTYATGGIETQDEYAWGKNALGLSGAGNMTGHYLNTPVPENYTNNGTTGDFSLNYERQFTTKDHLTMIASHELARYEIPNELVQQNGGYVPNGNNTDGCSGPDPAADNCVTIPGGQLQTGDNFETMGIVSYEHVFSPKTMGDLRGMVRDNSLDFSSNPASWPVNVTQHNDFKNVYFNGSITADRGHQEWKAGIQSDNKLLHESLSYLIPDCTDPNDPQCPFNVGVIDVAATSFAFMGSRPDLEQAAYVEDSAQLDDWSIHAGLRWDHYQLMVNKNAFSPRVAIARYFPSVGIKVHGSWDHVFQTPSFENILLSSSPEAQALDTSVPIVQLPVEPARGNYYELGATKALFGKLRVDADMYRRDVNNYADDSQIFSTGISFPIAFRKAIIYGAEGKLEVQQWGRFSGFASYSYMVGNVWNPVTGGLFLGGDALDATSQLTGHSPDSQDQRHSLRDRVRCQVASRVWIALGSDFNSGLPFDANQTVQQDVSEYGQAVVNRLNFDHGRILPYLTEDASMSAELYKREKVSVRLQADGENLSNTLEVVDFGGLFSGNAIGPERSGMLRLTTEF